jgi:hypothetical protein
MAGKGIVNITLIAAGAVIAFVFAFADCLGVGSQPGFGFNQLTGTIIGVIIIGIGLLVKCKKSE